MNMTKREWKNGTTDDLPGGPWKNEPDKVQWVDEASGLDCLIVRNSLGALCGYVGVPPQHPWHRKGYGECLIGEACGSEWHYECTPEAAVRAHGGLTYADACGESERGEAFGICHVPFPGREHDIWWFGFDCAHAGDLTPYGSDRWGFGGDEYRDVEYVSAEVAYLARQLAGVA